MRTEIVSNEEEFKSVTKKMEDLGFKLASISNTGLTGDKVRVTFLPNEFFNT